MPSCSKAPRGLFVLLPVGRIFTANSNSPSLFSRQLQSRFTFRAGRNFNTLYIAIKFRLYLIHLRILTYSRWGFSDCSESFLLIDSTEQIFTLTSTVGYWVIPAFSQIFTRLLHLLTKTFSDSWVPRYKYRGRASCVTNPTRNFATIEQFTFVTVSI